MNALIKTFSDYATSKPAFDMAINSEKMPGEEKAPLATVKYVGHMLVDSALVSLGYAAYNHVVHPARSVLDPVLSVMSSSWDTPMSSAPAAASTMLAMGMFGSMLGQLVCAFPFPEFCPQDTDKINNKTKGVIFRGMGIVGAAASMLFWPAVEASRKQNSEQAKPQEININIEIGHVGKFNETAENVIAANLNTIAFYPAPVLTPN